MQTWWKSKGQKQAETAEKENERKCISEVKLTVFGHVIKPESKGQRQLTNIGSKDS